MQVRPSLLVALPLCTAQRSPASEASTNCGASLPLMLCLAVKKGTLHLATQCLPRAEGSSMETGQTACFMPVECVLRSPADGATALRSSGNTISYTPLGRAYNRFNPALGQTMNAAMLAVIYGDAIAPQNATELEIVQNPSHALPSNRACTENHR